VKQLGGMRKMKVLSQGNETAKMSKFHKRISPSLQAKARALINVPSLFDLAFEGWANLTRLPLVQVSFTDFYSLL
jgi:hypothetical protein